MLLIPAGICSSQHRPLDLEHPITIPAPLFYDYTGENVFIDNDGLEETVVEEEDQIRPEATGPVLPFHDHILQASKTYQVDAALIRAIIMAESNYDPNAVSHRGAQGLMQLMPTTAKWLGVHNSFDPALNIDGGVRYFKKLLQRFDNNVQLALAAYNAGSRYVLQYGGVPPFRATKVYIKKVLNYQSIIQGETVAQESGSISS